MDILSGKKSKKNVFSVLYLPPPVQNNLLETFIEGCNAFLENNECLTCIMGDFNLGSIDWNLVDDNSSLLNASKACKLLIDFSQINRLKQGNKVNNSKGKTLDLVFVNSSSFDVTPALGGLSTIDPLHPPLEIELIVDSSDRMAASVSDRYSFWQGDYEAINAKLTELDWDALFRDCGDVNDYINVFYSKIREIISKHVPLTKVKPKSSFPPWFPKDLIKILREKNKLEKGFQSIKIPWTSLS